MKRFFRSPEEIFDLLENIFRVSEQLLKETIKINLSSLRSVYVESKASEKSYPYPPGTRCATLRVLS